MYWGNFAGAGILVLIFGKMIYDFIKPERYIQVTSQSYSRPHFRSYINDDPKDNLKLLKHDISKLYDIDDMISKGITETFRYKITDQKKAVLTLMERIERAARFAGVTMNDEDQALLKKYEHYYDICLRCKCGRMKPSGAYGEKLVCNNPMCRIYKVREFGLCPKCKSPLVVKKGPYGEFIGCKGYKENNCKFTAPVDYFCN